MTKVKLTKQGVRDLNTKPVNGKKKGPYECEHIWTDWVTSDSPYTATTNSRECQLCGNKEVERARY